MYYSQLYIALYLATLHHTYTLPQARLKRIRKQEEYLANQRRLEGFANGTDHDRDAEGEGEGDGIKEVEKEGVSGKEKETSSSKNKEESKDTHTILTHNTQNNHTQSDKMPTLPPASSPPASSTSPAASPQVSPRPPPPLHFSQEKTHLIPKITCPNDFI